MGQRARSHGAGEILNVQACGAQRVGLGAELQRPSTLDLCSDGHKRLLKLDALPIFMLRTGGRGAC